LTLSIVSLAIYEVQKNYAYNLKRVQAYKKSWDDCSKKFIRLTAGTVFLYSVREKEKSLIPKVPVAHLKKLFSFRTDKGLKSLESLTTLL
jgi:hypothetical protein